MQSNPGCDRSDVGADPASERGLASPLLRSLRRGLERADATVTTSSDPAAIAAADALVLPGVGVFGECVRNSRPFHDALVEAAADTPILGICVGL